MLSRLWPNFSRRYNFFWLWNHWSCYYFRVLRKECGKAKRVLWDNLWFIGRQQMKFTTWINDSMIKIILRMCVRDEDRIIFRTCNLTPLSQKFWIGSDQIGSLTDGCPYLCRTIINFNTAQTWYFAHQSAIWHAMTRLLFSHPLTRCFV